MRLYSGTTSQLHEDTAQNQIAGKLADAFFRHFRFRPPPSEVTSWQNSLRAVCLVFDRADLHDHGVMLEYQLPLTSKRLDCLVCGKGEGDADHAVIVELKQWERCGEAFGDDLVLTWLGGREREVLHPSAQVSQYRRYLQDSHTAFYEGPSPIGLASCAYLHNYHRGDGDVLFDRRHGALLEDSPVFTADDSNDLSLLLRRELGKGQGSSVLQRVEQGRYRPSKRLMDHVAAVIKGVPQYVLLDEQLVVYQQVQAYARAGFHDRRKTVVIVQGGPGTGKSVIAINLMSDLLRQGYSTQYATGSRAFTKTLRRVIGKAGEVQFNYFNTYSTADANDIDVLICDEAHRLRKSSVNRFTPKTERSNREQIEELLHAAKVCVFFIDDRQVVRPGEIGSSPYIREQAERQGCRVIEHRLEAQFRCAGSEAFVSWIDNTLGIERTPHILWDMRESFDFRILTSPEALEAAIGERASQGFTARLTAGFCWPWSEPRRDGTLVDDVVVGSFARPWNAKSGAGRLAKGIPPESLWANEPGGLGQVGCVYTAQGFEFDYAGVIFGDDLVYRFDRHGWEGRPNASHDSVVKRSKEQFLELVRNTYRVLLSRGLKGCYVYFIDKESEQFFRSRIEPADEAGRAEETLRSVEPPAAKALLPFRLLRVDEVRPYDNCVPVYELAAAAGRFGDPQIPAESLHGEELQHPERFAWAELPEAFRPRPGLFIAQVVGESMNRRIPSGAWCLFRLFPQGSREGKVVLVQSRQLYDPETGGSFAVKVYRSEKAMDADGQWRHTRIVLQPDSREAGHEAIVIDEQDDVRVLAELVALLG